MSNSQEGGSLLLLACFNNVPEIINLVIRDECFLNSRTFQKLVGRHLYSYSINKIGAALQGFSEFFRSNLLQVSTTVQNKKS